MKRASSTVFLKCLLPTHAALMTSTQSNTLMVHTVLSVWLHILTHSHIDYNRAHLLLTISDQFWHNLVGQIYYTFSIGSH